MDKRQEEKIQLVRGNSFNSMCQWLSVGSYFVERNPESSWSDVEEHIRKILDSFYTKDQSWTVEFVASVGNKDNLVNLIISMLKCQDQFYKETEILMVKEIIVKNKDIIEQAETVARIRWFDGLSDSKLSQKTEIPMHTIFRISESQEYLEFVRNFLLEYRTEEQYWKWRKNYKNIEGRLSRRMGIEREQIIELLKISDAHHANDDEN